MLVCALLMIETLGEKTNRIGDFELGSDLNLPRLAENHLITLFTNQI